MKPSKSLAIVILAAGQGTRMKSQLPKVLHPVAGETMLAHVLKTASRLAPERIILVLAPGMEQVAKAAEMMAPVRIAIQQEAKGTGHAVMAALPMLEGFSGKVLVLYGDSPLIRAETLAALAEAASPLALLGMEVARENAYGRLVLNKEKKALRIVEYKDANSEERALTLCNAGFMAVESEALQKLLPQIGCANAKKEYYLTDLVALAAGEKGSHVVIAEEKEVMGVNAKSELAEAESEMQQRLRKQAMERGVTLIDPSSVFLSSDTEIGADTVIHPFVVIGKQAKIGKGVEIRSFSHLAECTVEDGAIIGPYARLRPGASIGKEAHIGNFVEIKNSCIAEGAKVNHLSYVGDSSVGKGANIGAGTITCNYDGVNKHKTVIGEGAFIGSNSALVAPVTIGAGAVIAAGSAITKDVEPGALAVERSEQRQVKDWAKCRKGNT